MEPPYSRPRCCWVNPTWRPPMKDVLAWLIGIPIPMIIILYLIDVF
jgi:hypothetical protein